MTYNDWKIGSCEDCGKMAQTKFTKGAFTNWWLCSECRATFLAYMYHFHLAWLT